MTTRSVEKPKITICFTYNKYRNDRLKSSHLNAVIRPYWKDMYNDMFKAW